MDILQLSARFQYYAQKHKLLKYVPGDPKKRSYFECDAEEVAAAIKTGLSLPCLLLQTPTFEKDGSVDNATEHPECSFIILDHLPNGAPKFPLYHKLKGIADQIVNHIIADAPEYFEGGLIKTSEGAFGPIGDRLFGYAVNFGFEQAYNAELDPGQWEEEE